MRYIKPTWFWRISAGPWRGRRPVRAIAASTAPLAARTDQALDTSLADTALLHGVMAGTDPREPLSWPAADASAPDLEPVDLGSLRVAISDDLGFAPDDDGHPPDVPRCGRPLPRRVRRADEQDPPLDDSVNQVFEVNRARFPRRSWGPNIRANVEQGGAMSALDVARAMRRHGELYWDFLDFMAGYNALICPAMAVPPFPHRQLYVEAINGERLRTYFHWLALAYGLTLTAHPVACIPCGRDHTGMPFGIQVCGRRFGDHRTLTVAAALERHLQSVPELARPVPDLNARSSG